MVPVVEAERAATGVALPLVESANGQANRKSKLMQFTEIASFLETWLAAVSNDRVLTKLVKPL